MADRLMCLPINQALLVQALHRDRTRIPHDTSTGWFQEADSSDLPKLQKAVSQTN